MQDIKLTNLQLLNVKSYIDSGLSGNESNAPHYEIDGQFIVIDGRLSYGDLIALAGIALKPERDADRSMALMQQPEYLRWCADAFEKKLESRNKEGLIRHVAAMQGSLSLMLDLIDSMPSEEGEDDGKS